MSLVWRLALRDLRGSRAGLRLLAAEMQALASMMPGLAAPSALPSDPEVEAEFDNMPV